MVHAGGPGGDARADRWPGWCDLPGLADNRRRRVVCDYTDGGVGGGNGIEHIAVTPSGRIWAGYFDEGVYGNNGWGGNGASAPIGAAGLVAFDNHLRPEWRYPPMGGLGPISDCYALNVIGETAWACYYTDFPIVRVGDGRVSSWNNQIAGAKHLLVAPGHGAALVGGWTGARWRIGAGRLGAVEFDITAQFRLTMPDGSEPPSDTHLIGRGPDLHAVVGDTWYRLDLDTLLSQQPRKLQH